MAADTQTLLAFDYGTQKIGVAVGQTLTATASALQPLKARDGIPDWSAIETLILEWKATALVVGLPLNMDDSEGQLSQRARKFARRLEGRFALPCHLVDERLSTREAREIHRDNATRRGRRPDHRAAVDSLSAQLILESFLRDRS